MNRPHADLASIDYLVQLQLDRKVTISNQSPKISQLSVTNLTQDKSPSSSIP